MSEEKHHQSLQIPLYRLIFAEDGDDLTELVLATAAGISKDYPPEEVRGIVNDLEWASRHPDFPFASLLRGITYPAAQTYAFLLAVLKRLRELGVAD